MRRRGSLHGHTESAFTRQVVNTGLTGTFGRKKLSPSNSVCHSPFIHSNNPEITNGCQIIHTSLLLNLQTNVLDIDEQYLEQKLIGFFLYK